jgi:hypothetical protein
VHRAGAGPLPYQEFVLWVVDFYHDHVEAKVVLVPTESHRLATEECTEDQNPVDRFLEGTFEVTHHTDDKVSTTRVRPIDMSEHDRIQAPCHRSSRCHVE